jgi:hypothetical protein
VEIVAVNDPFIDTDYIEYMFKCVPHSFVMLLLIISCGGRALSVCVPCVCGGRYDTVHGRYKGTVSHDDKHLIVDGKKIRAFQEKEADKIKWGEPPTRTHKHRQPFELPCHKTLRESSPPVMLTGVCLVCCLWHRRRRR